MAKIEQVITCDDNTLRIGDSGIIVIENGSYCSMVQGTLIEILSNGYCTFKNPRHTIKVPVKHIIEIGNNLKDMPIAKNIINQSHDVKTNISRLKNDKELNCLPLFRKEV